jgi:hypothetical protein
MSTVPSEFSFGHFLTLTPRETGAAPFYFQNFFSPGVGPTSDGKTIYDGKTYNFLPFGFSGVTVNRSGDNQLTQLAFPNNELSKSWTARLVQESWIISIDMVYINPTPNRNFQLLSEFAGQVTGAVWTETELRVEVSSIIDAVGNDIPRRRITEDVFGPLPTTSNLRLS